MTTLLHKNYELFDRRVTGHFAAHQVQDTWPDNQKEELQAILPRQVTSGFLMSFRLESLMQAKRLSHNSLVLVAGEKTGQEV